MTPFYRTTLLLLVLAAAAQAASEPSTVEQTFDEIVARDGGAGEARVRLFTDNSDSWVARWSTIEKARESIVFDKDCENALEYKILVDETGQEVEVQGPADHVGRTLLEKAKKSEWLKFLRPIL